MFDNRITIHAGEIVALVGPSGAGKTTLAGLVTRFRDPSSGSVRIAYGMANYDRARLMNADKAALAHDFIERFPQGYETVIGDRGVKLSGGQSEMLVQGALENLMPGRQ